MDFSTLSTERLLDMQAAGDDVITCQRVLAKAGLNIVGEVLKGVETFYRMNHYPEGDVYDHETHSQYYYHAHRENEHGHFHTFLRPKGMPEGIKPVKVDDFEEPKQENDALSHIVAVSMDEYGQAKALFTTNRWVTAEYWYKAEDVIEMLDYFDIDHASPSWPTNKWIGAFIRLYYPQICELLHTRDKVIADWKEQYPDRNVFEDRDLEITSEVKCSFTEQIQLIEDELKKRA